MDTSASSSGPPPLPRLDDAPRIKRVNKACLNCRKRKSRCQLEFENGVVQLPCLRCKKENLECILGGSNRGGRRVRRKTMEAQMLNPPPGGLQLHPAEENAGFHGLGNVGTYGLNRQGQSVTPADESASSPENIPFPHLQTPSDALGILAQVAEEDNPVAPKITQPSSIPVIRRATSAPHAQRTEITYSLLDQGELTVQNILRLLERYEGLYHPYFPLAPREVFNPSRLAETAKHEPHLLTAILVIASKDVVEEPNIHEACSSYMKTLVSDLASGAGGGVEAVEALLLLAEWTPYTQRVQTGPVGRGEEDREAWMKIGLALRIAYFLGLDRYSFKATNEGVDPQFARKRLVWTACYICDRQISNRTGKAFWSRGPGPLLTLRREDYPSLLPQNPNDEDYASIFQATLELTQIFSNVHDVLYSNLGSSFRGHLSGGYIKFIDDFRSALYGWKSVWGTLTCSPNLKAMLLMSYDYLRLYTNAFAFQATIRRALPPSDDNANPTSQQSPSRVFYNNVASVGDARFIYEGLDAAKAVLTTANNFVDPERALRHMPLRFYLYLVYAGVFLYRARCVGVMGPEEERAIRSMVNETVNRLQRASVGHKHLGSRYSQLLKLLWAKVDHKQSRSRASRTAPVSGESNGAAASGPSSAPSITGSNTGESPAFTEQMGDFAWTDLMAVGDFAINGATTGTQSNEEGVFAGFLPLELGVGWEGMGFEGGDVGTTF